MSKIAARPNLNGNTEADFAQAGLDLLDRVEEVRKALVKTREMLHGRNYQTVDETQRGFDKVRLESYISATFAMEAYAQELIAIGAGINITD